MRCERVLALDHNSLTRGHSGGSVGGRRTVRHGRHQCDTREDSTRDGNPCGRHSDSKSTPRDTSDENDKS